MQRCGLSKSDSCDCGAEQMADHITSGRCPIFRPLEGIRGLIDLYLTHDCDLRTLTWTYEWFLMSHVRRITEDSFRQNSWSFRWGQHNAYLPVGDHVNVYLCCSQINNSGIMATLFINP